MAITDEITGIQRVVKVGKQQNVPRTVKVWNSKITNFRKELKNLYELLFDFY